LIAVDIGDLAFAGSRDAKARIEGEHTLIARQVRNIDDIRSDGAGAHGKFRLDAGGRIYELEGLVSHARRSL